MDLFIMRHGQARSVGGPITEDAQRPLMPAGLRQVAAVAKQLRVQNIAIDRIYCSPLVRARETAAAMANGLGLPPPEQTPLLAPNASPAAARSLLRPSQSKAMLWVGHHPDVSLWIAFLCAIDPAAAPAFAPASMAALRCSADGSSARFLWFQTAEQLISGH